MSWALLGRSWESCSGKLCSGELCLGKLCLSELCSAKQAQNSHRRTEFSKLPTGCYRDKHSVAFEGRELANSLSFELIYTGVTCINLQIHSAPGNYQFFHAGVNPRLKPCNPASFSTRDLTWHRISIKSTSSTILDVHTPENTTSKQNH